MKAEGLQAEQMSDGLMSNRSETPTFDAVEGSSIDGEMCRSASRLSQSKVSGEPAEHLERMTSSGVETAMQLGLISLSSFTQKAERQRTGRFELASTGETDKRH